MKPQDTPEALLTEAGASRRLVGRYVMAEAKLQKLEAEARRTGAINVSLPEKGQIIIWWRAGDDFGYRSEPDEPPCRPWLERDEVLALLAEEPTESAAREPSGCECHIDFHKTGPTECDSDATIAMCPLHADAQETASERDRLRAVNADLLAALKTLLPLAWGWQEALAGDSEHDDELDIKILQRARAAIARAEAT